MYLQIQYKIQFNEEIIYFIFHFHLMITVLQNVSPIFVMFISMLQYFVFFRKEITLITFHLLYKMYSRQNMKNIQSTIYSYLVLYSTYKESCATIGQK